MTKKIKRALVFVLFLLPISAMASDFNNMYGGWGSIILKGDFKSFSPKAEKFHWLVMNQTRTRGEQVNNSKFTENLLFGQIGYDINERLSVWFGYTREWGRPLNKPSFRENRAYQDILWKQGFDHFKLTSRTRLDERFLEGSNEEGYRLRQLVNISHPLPFGSNLSAYIGDEALFYLNNSKFGEKGFSENRIFTGISKQITSQTKLDIGYLGQYINTKSGDNIFTHNLQLNLAYSF
jgi:hypothetical protein